MSCPINKVANLFTKLKNKTPELLQSDIVPKIDCSDCEKSYIAIRKQTKKGKAVLEIHNFTIMTSILTLKTYIFCILKTNVTKEPLVRTWYLPIQYNFLNLYKNSIFD